MKQHNAVALMRAYGISLDYNPKLSPKRLRSKIPTKMCFSHPSCSLDYGSKNAVMLPWEALNTFLFPVVQIFGGEFLQRKKVSDLPSLSPQFSTA
jgi:hypothetical protein